jgi:hypothetical protein
MTQSLKQLSKKASLLELQISLEENRRTNLEAFRTLMPSLYGDLLALEPKRFQLGIDSDFQVNLIRSKDGKQVYGTDVQVFCANQVRDFLGNPRLSTINFGEEITFSGERYFHGQLINEAQRELDREKLVISKDISEHVLPSMVISGCGLGWHIDELINLLDIQHLIIYESEIDMFYASLCVLDWAKILLKFRKKGRRIDLLLGDDPHRGTLRAFELIKETGSFRSVFTFTYDHALVPAHSAFLERFRASHRTVFDGFGFVEDEQIGIAHSIANIENQVGVFSQLGSVLPDDVAVVVGNGPSLDQLEPYLIKNHSRLTIFSCGTALASLRKMGIKPDVHVEQERNYFLSQVIDKSTDASFRSGIKMVGLNTVHPETFKLFEESFMACKPNDAGGSILNSELGQNFIEAPHCNPTVTNFGLSLAICLGYRKIVLVGVDFGMKRGGEHHSKLSVYAKGLKSATSDAQHLVPGNFGSSVFSNHLLDHSRMMVESLITKLIGIEVYNPNDGALINGTIPSEVEDLPVGQLGKAKVLNDRFNHCFTKKNLKGLRKRLKKAYTSEFLKLVQQIRLPERLPPKQEFLSSLDRVLEQTNSSKQWAKLISVGATKYYLCLLMRYCYYMDDQEASENYLRLKAAFDEFLERSHSLIASRALEPCDMTIDVKSLA